MKFFIFISILFLVWVSSGCSRGNSPEHRALDLVRESHAIDDDMSVYQSIDRLLKGEKEEIKVIGWDAQKLSQKKYLVSYRYNIYSFARGTGEMGFFFEVDLADGSVKNITEKYLDQLKPLSKAYNGEEAIVEELIDKAEPVTTVQ